MTASFAPHEYTVKLSSSSIAQDDIGSIIKQAPATMALNVSNSTYGHQIVVLHNNIKIFDTKTESNTCGLSKNWDGQSFKINWKPGDSIQIGFYSFVNTSVLNNAWHTIFKTKDSSNCSILLLQGSVTGGIRNTSCVVFKQ